MTMLLPPAPPLLPAALPPLARELDGKADKEMERPFLTWIGIGDDRPGVSGTGEVAKLDLEADGIA